MNTRFFSQDNNATKARLIRESIKQTNALLEGVSSKQEIVVMDEYLEKITTFLNSLLQKSEDLTIFHQLIIQLNIKRLINPIVTLDICDSTANHLYSRVEVVDSKRHESTLEYTFTPCLDPTLLLEFKEYLNNEIKKSITHKFAFSENCHVNGMIIDMTLTAYNLDNDIMSQVRLEEIFKNAPDPEYNIDLIQNHHVSF